MGKKTRAVVLSRYRKYLRVSGQQENKALFKASNDLAEKHRYISSELDEKPSMGNNGSLEVLYMLSRFINKKYPGQWKALID